MGSQYATAQSGNLGASAAPIRSAVRCATLPHPHDLQSASPLPLTELTVCYTWFRVVAFNRSDKVRLIDQQQNMVGIVSKSEAVQKAEDAELDLVILSPEADPPVVRIMDYNYNIDVHDYSVRLKAAQKFLKEGDKVKVIVNLKGRENEFRSKAVELLKQFQNDVGELATLEGKNFNDRNMFIILVPNKAIAQKAQEQPKKKEKSATEVSAGV
nr:translation initiation factor IF-3-like [Ipomoea batatas]